MATKNTTEPTPAPAPGPPPAPPKKEAKPGELKALFAAYEKSNAAVTAASNAYDKAMADRSKVVEQFAAYGQAFTSPSGDRLTVTKRTNKETGATAYYFKGPGKAEALKIE